MSATRWLSIETAVSRIYDQYEELKVHFRIAKDKEDCMAAQILYDMYCDDKNYAYLCFLKPILGEVQKVNKSFESNTADSPKLLDDFMALLENLVKKVTPPNSSFKLFVNKLESFTDEHCYLGYLFEKKIAEMKSNNDFKEEAYIRKRCTDFIVKLVNQLVQRTPDNINILRKISMFSIENTLKVNKESIIPLLEHFKYDPNVIDKIERQWRTITLFKWEKTTTVDFWTEVFNFKNADNENPFIDLAKAALTFLILPHSNAEVERLFSEMNIVKCKLRNRMLNAMLVALLTIRSGMRRNNKCCCSYDIPDKVLEKIKTKDCYACDNSDENICDVDSCINEISSLLP